MRQGLKRLLGAAALVIVVIVVVLAWPLPDPLAGGERVYIRWGITLLPEGWRGSIGAGIEATVGDRDVTFVLDEREADVILVLRSFSVSSEDEFLSTGTGYARLVFRAIDVRTRDEHTLDLNVRARQWHVDQVELRTRRFWEFWK